MAAIPTIALSGVPASQLGVKLDAAPLMASSRAREDAWRTVGQAAQVVGSIVKQRQDHLDRGTLASEDTIRQKTAAAVQGFMDENQGEPEKWKQFHEQTWKSYEADRLKRAKSWGPKLLEEDNIRMASYKGDTDVRFQTEQNRALIRKANSQIEANANMRMDNGDIRGAIEQVNSMNIAPEERSKKVDQFINGGLYRMYEKMLTDVSQLPPAKQIKEYRSIEAGVMARNAKGNYASGTISDDKGQVIGMMGESARLNVLRAARAQVDYANTKMAHVGSSLVRQVEAGADPAMAFKQAMDRGEITPEVAAVYVPEARLAVDKKNDVIAARKDRAGQTVMREIDRSTGTNMTLQEIERRQAIGITRPNDPQGLSAEGAKLARQELVALQDSEWASLGDNSNSIRSKLEEKLGRSMFFTRFSDKAQMTPEEQRKTLESIAAEPASVATKGKLLELYFNVQRADLKELEISERDGDRNISPEEKAVRTNLIDRYKQSIGAMSAQNLGSQYMSDMEQIGNWFRTNPNATPEQRKAKAAEFSDKLGRGFDHQVGSTILDDIPAFQ